MEYESYLNDNTIFIHHALESAENVIKFRAYEQVKSLGTAVESISEIVSIHSLGTILDAAADKVLSKETVQRLCFGIFLVDNDRYVGAIDSSSYRCYCMSTVERLKRQLVDQTLSKTAEILGSEICMGILKHIEANITSILEQIFLNLNFEISENVFESITTTFATVVAIFNPIRYLVGNVGSFIVTFMLSIDVNSTDWRRKVAYEIYEKIAKFKNDILKKIRFQIEQMCLQTVQELSAVSKTISDLRRTMGHTEQRTCK